MKTSRPYTMGARARAVEETRRRIADALVDLAGRKPFADISLEDVARTAGVSVQTVLRQFGSRDQLFAAASDHAMKVTAEERRTPAGDVAAAFRVLGEHYEKDGRRALLMLAQEDHDPFARTMTDRGKAMHRDWVREVFAPATDDEEVLDLLVVATDVYTWKLLRIDRGLSRATTLRRMQALAEGVLGAAGVTLHPAEHDHA